MSNRLGPTLLSLSFNEDTNTLTRGLLCGQQYDTTLYKVPWVEALDRKQVGSDANWPALTVWLMPSSQIKQWRRRESTSINCDEGEATRHMLFLFVSRPTTPSPPPQPPPPHIWRPIVTGAVNHGEGLRVYPALLDPKLRFEGRMQLRAVKGAMKCELMLLVTVRWQDETEICLHPKWGESHPKVLTINTFGNHVSAAERRNSLSPNLFFFLFQLVFYLSKISAGFFCKK